MSTLGERIRERRKNKGLTQEVMGKDLSLAKSTISQYENNINVPDAIMLKNLADYLDTTADYLLCRVDNPNSIVVTGTDFQQYLPDEYKKDSEDIIAIINKNVELTEGNLNKLAQFVIKKLQEYQDKDQDN